MDFFYKHMTTSYLIIALGRAGDRSFVPRVFEKAIALACYPVSKASQYYLQQQRRGFVHPDSNSHHKLDFYDQ